MEKMRVGLEKNLKTLIEFTSIFGNYRVLNLIPTTYELGGDYVHHITSRSPRLQTFLRPYAVQNYSRVWSTVIGKNLQLHIRP